MPNKDWEDKKKQYKEEYRCWNAPALKEAIIGYRMALEALESSIPKIQEEAKREMVKIARKEITKYESWCKEADHHPAERSCNCEWVAKAEALEDFIEDIALKDTDSDRGEK